MLGQGPKLFTTEEITVPGPIWKPHPPNNCATEQDHGPMSASAAYILETNMRAVVWMEPYSPCEEGGPFDSHGGRGEAARPAIPSAEKVEP